MRATGAELMAFYAEWPFEPKDDWRTDNVDERYYNEAGDLVLAPTTKYDVSTVLGDLIFDANGDQTCIVGGVPIDVNDYRAMVKAFRAWREAQGRFVVVRMPPGGDTAYGELMALAKRHGWTVQG